MATHAGPPTFDEVDVSWEAYRVRLDAFFEAYEIYDPKKRSALLEAQGAALVTELAARNIQQILPVKEQLKVSVTYAGKTVNVTLVVHGCSGRNLCRRNIVQAFQLAGGPELNVDANNSKPRSVVSRDQ
ncbi:hypothetical protein MRX96_044666 [Rhipicephalus microplus]